MLACRRYILLLALGILAIAKPCKNDSSAKNLKDLKVVVDWTDPNLTFSSIKRVKVP